MMEPNMMYNYQMMMNMNPQMGKEMMMPQGQNQQGNNNEAK